MTIEQEAKTEEMSKLLSGIVESRDTILDKERLLTRNIDKLETIVQSTITRHVTST